MVSKLPIIFERTRTIYDLNTCWLLLLLLLLLLHLAAVVVVVVLLLLGCICTDTHMPHLQPFTHSRGGRSGCVDASHGQIGVIIHIVLNPALAQDSVWLPSQTIACT